MQSHIISISHTQKKSYFLKLYSPYRPPQKIAMRLLSLSRFMPHYPNYVTIGTLHLQNYSYSLSMCCNTEDQLVLVGFYTCKAGICHLTNPTDDKTPYIIEICGGFIIYKRHTRILVTRKQSLAEHHQHFVVTRPQSYSTQLVKRP